MSFFNDLFGVTGARAANEARIAAERRAAEIQRANQTEIDRGTTAAGGFLRQQGDLYRPLSELGMGSLGASNAAYNDALGLGGADGAARARAMFQASPGFDFARDQALEGVMRRQNAMGMLGSGNTLAALQDRGTQLANQEWGSWLDRLNQNRQFGAGLYGQGAAGQAQSLGGLAGLEQWAVGARTGNNNLAQTAMNNANQFGLMGAQASSQGAANALSGGIQLARLAAQMFGNRSGQMGGGSGIPDLYG